MKHLATYLLLQLGGTAEPTKEDIAKALEAVGIEMDDTRCDTLLKELHGKDMTEIITQGKTMLATFGGGSGSGGSGSAATAATTTADTPAPEKEEEKEEEEVDVGGGNLFGDEEGGGGGDY